MTELSAGLQRELAFTFGSAITFDQAERFACSCDPSDLPRSPGPLPDLDKVLKTKPYAVLRPRNRGDLLEVIKFGKRFNVPLVPRGGGTSLNGASVPAEGGITVDMTGFRAILSIDRQKREVDVEAGMKLWELQRVLERDGLMLRTYPDTALGATVGGAIGANEPGYGSAAFGRFGDCVREVELLSPDERVRTLHGGELDLAVGAEGSTGFILRARLAVCAKEEIVPLALSFDTLASAVKA
ncbi:MAG TPA: FAD-binding oxidoreductase, partial [Burkholderiales bacterium]|nr:FAD-binding oxidoreductase [Burkholderiales bacterium]